MGKGNFQLRVSFTHLYFLFGDSSSLFPFSSYSFLFSYGILGAILICPFIFRFPALTYHIINQQIAVAYP